MNLKDAQLLREEVKPIVRVTIPDILARLDRLEAMPGSTAQRVIDAETAEKKKVDAATKKIEKDRRDKELATALKRRKDADAKAQAVAEAIEKSRVAKEKAARAKQKKEQAAGLQPK